MSWSSPTGQGGVVEAVVPAVPVPVGVVVVGVVLVVGVVVVGGVLVVGVVGVGGVLVVGVVVVGVVVVVSVVPPGVRLDDPPPLVPVPGAVVVSADEPKMPCFRARPCTAGWGGRAAQGGGSM